MVKIRAIVPVLFLAGLAAGCPKKNAANVVSVAPKGEVREADARTGVRIQFDRPMVAAQALGNPIVPSPVSLTPSVPGFAVWLDPQTLVFTPTQKLLPSTRYDIRLDRQLLHGTSAAAGELGEASFVHERLAVRSIRLPAPGPEFQSTSPSITVAFSATVNPADALRACQFAAEGGKTIQAKLSETSTVADGADEPEDKGGTVSMVRLAPAATLEPGTGYTFRCSKDLKPATGSEGLSKDEERRFRTYGPFKVVKLSPEGNDVVPDDTNVKIEFSTPVDPAQVEKHVRLETTEDSRVKASFDSSANRTAYSWKGNLEPQTYYTLKVEGAITDVFGQRLGGDSEHRFRAGDAGPRLRIERGIYAVERSSGKYSVLTRNLPSFHVSCAKIGEERLARLLSGPINFDAWYGADEQPVDYKELGSKPTKKTIKPAHDKNKWVDASLDLAATCEAGAPPAAIAPSGVYLLELGSKDLMAREGERQRRVLANVTDLGLLAKVGDASSLVWVVRLSDGQPVAGATVKLRDLKGKIRFTGTSNADGVVQAPGASKLLGLKPRVQGNGEDHDEAYEEWDQRGERRMIVTAQAADDLAVLDTNWNSGLQVWNFGVSQAEQGSAELRVRGFLQSDRGLYRPGDTVHLRGLVRTIDLTGKMRVPKGKKAHLLVEDPKGKVLVEEDLPITAFGGFHRDLVIEGEARLGDYRVHGTVLGQPFADKFAVEEYRPRTFEVKLTTPKPYLFSGQAIAFQVAADYLYGAPLKGGKVSWNVRRRAHAPSFPDYPQYVFQDFVKLWSEGNYWSRYEERSFSSLVQDGERDLDEKGRARIVAKDEEKDVSGPQDLLIQAGVTDSRGEGVTASKALVMHRSSVYLGLHSGEIVQTTNAPWNIQAIALSPDGKRKTVADAELTVTPERWECEHTWPCERKVGAPVVTRKLSIPETGAAVEKIEVQLPGVYQVRLSASDGRGGTAVASDTMYVIGKGEAFWSGNEGERMTVVASKPKYKQGEVAKLVPQANLPGAISLVTLERDGVMQYSVRRLETSGEALQVPIDARHAPNVYAGVVLVRGRTGPGDKGQPAFKAGLVNLEVDSGDRQLRLSLETDSPSYRPGDAVTATVKVRSAEGKPVKAEMALAVADEGVLQIAGYKTPDPLSKFYASYGLGVGWSTTWNRLAKPQAPSDTDADDEGEGGDAGGEEAGRIRNRFMATAYWNPALVTGPDGSAKVTFTAPDNLTAFRVMAVAADSGERFGSGEKRFAVNKPLQAMPALPRFLTKGDAVAAKVMIHNNTQAPVKATVTALVEGAAHLTGAPSQPVDVPAGSAKPVIFAVAAENEGQADFTFKVTGGGMNDAVKNSLPIERPTTTETSLIGEGIAKQRAEHPVAVPANVLRGKGDLEVVLDPTGLARLDEGLAYLVHYPYGCLEQTTSKVVPMLAISDLASSIDLPEVNQARLKTFINAGIVKILKHQHDNGGFGLWIGAPVEQHYTAFGLWGLAVAKSTGQAVDSAALTKGAQWLARSLARNPDEGHYYMGAAASRAFALYVLADLHARSIGPGADAAMLSALMDKRQALPRYGRAFLARALFRADRREDARKVLDELATDAKPGSGPLTMGESNDDELWWYWSSTPRTTAMVLLAFLDIAPSHPLVERLAEGLLSTRQGGRWENTQENLYSLLALAELSRIRAGAANAKVTVSVDGKQRFSDTLTGADVRRVRVPLDQVGAGPLVIQSEGSAIYYTARIHSVRAMDSAGTNAGIAVKREYLDADSGQPITQAKLGQVVKVRLTLDTPQARAHVAVVDRLPAGLEPILDRFQQKPEEEGVHWWWMRSTTEWQNRQLRDDRVELFTDLLIKGESRHEYLARAMSEGTFEHPGVTAEMMYRPTVHGRGPAGQMVVAH
jgi:alpha-2-macroglobulin